MNQNLVKESDSNPAYNANLQSSYRPPIQEKSTTDQSSSIILNLTDLSDPVPQDFKVLVNEALSSSDSELLRRCNNQRKLKQMKSMHPDFYGIELDHTQNLKEFRHQLEIAEKFLLW